MRKYFYILVCVLLILLSGCSIQGNSKVDIKKDEVRIQKNTNEKKKGSKTQKDTSTKATASESVKEEWIPITNPENAPEDWKRQLEPPYCLGCGKTKKEVSICRDGYCDTCFKTYYEPTLPHCDTCGEVLYGAGYIGTRHTECYHCDYCGGYWDSYMAYDSSYGYACSTCFIQQVIGCSECGVKGTNVDVSCSVCWDCQAVNRHQGGECNYCGMYSDSLTSEGLCPTCQQMREEIENYPW